jgi:hypothetical protein
MVDGELVDLPAGSVMGSEFIDPGQALPRSQRRHAVLLMGDVMRRLAGLPDNSVHCVVTSPPYWGLRDYGIPPSILNSVEVHDETGPV